MDKKLLNWKKTTNHNYIFSFNKAEEFVDFIGKLLLELGFNEKDVEQIDLYYPELKEGITIHLENKKFFIDLIIGDNSIFMFVQCSLENRKILESNFKKLGLNLNKY